MESDILRRKRRGRRLFFLLPLFLLPLIAMALVSRNMLPLLQAAAEARISSSAARAMNDAILSSMSDSEDYTALVQVRDNGEHVYLLQADARKMNLLAADCAEAAQDRIAALGEQGVTLPLGTLSGVAFFSGRGPQIRVSFSPVGSVQSAFRSEFVAAGINQTLYRVKLVLTSQVKLILPGVAKTVSVSAEAAICESILVGAVPEVYTNVEDTDDMLNLVPTEAP